jgi:uncharacterized membrane protein YcaP (DUF421 family)
MEDYAWDWQRIFFGSMPLLFYLEILFRVLILYAYTLLALRVLGRRSAGELTPLDLVIVISLGSAVGDPMFYPNIPVMHGIAVITVITLLQAAIVNLINRAEDVEQIIKGQPVRVLSDGIIDRSRLSDTNLSREELFMALRQRGYKSLGAIETMYIETDGKPSIYAVDAPRPGLPITPPWDVDKPTFYNSGQAVPEAGHYSMVRTGETRRFGAGEQFSKVGGEQVRWMASV